LGHVQRGPRPSGGWHSWLSVQGIETGGRMYCGGPTCFKPLFETLLRIYLLGNPAEPM
jgi:hypothetical protein